MEEITKPLTHIFNLTFVNGIIPENLKLAIVTPIFKADENNKFKNYRTISVLSCFPKLLEKLMYNRLISFIDKNQILSKHQYGFRKNRSTELAIIELVEKITKGMDGGKYIYVIYRLGGPYWKNIFPRSQKRPEAEGRGTLLRPREDIFQVRSDLNGK